VLCCLVRQNWNVSNQPVRKTYLHFCQISVTSSVVTSCMVNYFRMTMIMIMIFLHSKWLYVDIMFNVYLCVFMRIKCSTRVLPFGVIRELICLSSGLEYIGKME